MPDTSRSITAPAQGTASRIRWFMVVLLFVTTVINYVDRSSISIAGPAIRQDLHLTPVELGFIFSAFAWAYSPLQIPGSLLVDRIAPRFLYTGVIFFWSLCSTLLGFVSSFAGIFGLRLALGAFEAPSFPINNRVVTNWLPEHERARGVALFVSGQYVGLAFLTPVLVTSFRPASAGRACSSPPALSAFSGPPASSPSTAIRKNPNPAAPRPAPRNPATYHRSPAGRAFRNRRLWGLLMAHSSETAANWFFLTWFPTYLVRYRHIAFLKFGFLATLPFLAAYIGVLLSGTVSDHLLRRGHSLTFARKTPIVIGLILAMAIVGANFVDAPTLIIACMTVAFFGSGLGAISWSLVSSVAPPNLVGLASGAFNFVGTSMGIIVPIVIGLLVRGDNFAPAIIFVAAMSLLSLISYLFVMGPVEQVK